ncbi:unnamed protein product [Boreogadus saida]
MSLWNPSGSSPGPPCASLMASYSPIDQPALNVNPHSNRSMPGVPTTTTPPPPRAPSLAGDLLSGDTAALMTRFGTCSMGLLGLGRWKLWISNWKVTGC